MGSGTSEGWSKYGTVDVQLSWIKNIEFAGKYFAIEKGYYREAGFGAVNVHGAAGVEGVGPAHSSKTLS